jgi:hypothetical protein
VEKRNGQATRVMQLRMVFAADEHAGHIESSLDARMYQHRDDASRITSGKIARPFASLIFVSGSNPSETVKVTHQPRKFFTDLLGLQRLQRMILYWRRILQIIEPGRPQVSINDPERWLLSQAAKYIAQQEDSLPKEESPQLLHWSHHLIWALQSKHLSARANLFDAMYNEAAKIWEKNDLRMPNVEVEARFWYVGRDSIDFRHSSLLASNEGIMREYHLKPLVAGYENEETGDEGPLKTGFILSEITLSTKELFQHFPPREQDGRRISQTQSAGGRPAEYAWPAVKRQLTDYVSKHGPIQTRAGLLQKCADFATDLHPKRKTPDDKTIREAIKKHALDIAAGLTPGK